MNWFPAIVFGTPVLWVAWRIFRWAFPPYPYRVPWRWRWQTDYPEVPNSINPMRQALESRTILADLLREGHGAGNDDLLKEADRIIATVSAHMHAMVRLGFGYRNSNNLEWVDNKDPRFHALRTVVDVANGELEGITNALRRIAVSGVRVSAATLRLKLEIQQDDNLRMAEALNETPR